MERRLPRLASQLLTTAFSFVAAEFEADKRLPWQASQLLATAFSFVAAVVVPRLGGLSEGQSRGHSPMGHVNMDAEWPRDIHSYETRWQF